MCKCIPYGIPQTQIHQNPNPNAILASAAARSVDASRSRARRASHSRRSPSSQHGAGGDTATSARRSSSSARHRRSSACHSRLGCLICRYTDPATDSVAVHGPLGNKVRYSLLLYGPHSYTYIALVTSIRLSLHAILLQLIRLPGNIRLISLHGNNPVVTPYLVTG